MSVNEKISDIKLLNGSAGDLMSKDVIQKQHRALQQRVNQNSLIGGGPPTGPTTNLRFNPGKILLQQQLQIDNNASDQNETKA